MFADFYKNKRVLITGVAGVKGPWLALELLAAGSQVVGMDCQPPALDSNFAATNLGDQIEFVQGDVNDLPLMQSLLRDVDCVFHLAAISLVGEARRNPLETYRSNTLGTATVLEAIRLSPAVQYAVFVTTDKVYKAKGGEVWCEGDPLFATEPYPISKACAEMIIADYYRNYLRAAGKRIGIARAGNVLLGGDLYSSKRRPGAGHIHVDCFEALIEGRAPEIFTPKFTRPYTYGLDTLTGYMSLMARLDEEGNNGEAFNFGPHERYGVENGLLASKICSVWDSGLLWQSTTPRDEPFEKQSLNWDKARQRLGWQPAYTLYEGVQDLAHWYRAWGAQGQQLKPGSMATINAGLVQTHRTAADKLGIWWATT